MNVQSRPIASPKKRRSPLTFIGNLLILIGFGPLLILLNGGYSIQGMAWLSTVTGAYGRAFWALATAWTIDVPIVVRAGLPLAQPVLPWLAVVGISFIEVAFLLHRWRANGRSAAFEPMVDGSGALALIFDYATTATGIAFASFAVNLTGIVRLLWFLIAALLAVPVTFGFEALLSRLLTYFRR